MRYVTGSEAGLSGAEQIRIALQAIIDNGGSATMSQIIHALESALTTRDSQSRLSEQGKASLRFFVNKVAVDAGYVYKHDSKSTLWRITPKGHDNIVASPIKPYHAKMLTPIGQDFQISLADVYTLLGASKRLSPDDATDKEAFIRSGIILTVTAWEIFIEDTIKARFYDLVSKASDVEDMKKIVNMIAQSWISKFGDRRPNVKDVLRWSGDGWKAVVLEQFNDELSAFHSPNSGNISALFNRYIDTDIRSIWTWQGTTSDEACSKLDEMIIIRGGLVHRGRTSAEAALVDRERLVSMITLVEQLAWTTDAELNLKALPDLAKIAE